MADIQEAECFEFTYQIVPPQGAFREGQKNVPLRTYLPPPPFISVYALAITRFFQWLAVDLVFEKRLFEIKI